MDDVLCFLASRNSGGLIGNTQKWICLVDASWPLVNVSPTSWETLQSFSERATPAQHTFLLLGTAFPIARLWGMPPPLRNSHPSAPIQVPSESVRLPHPPSPKDMLLGLG